jgi:hypothetical protein
MSGSIPPPSAVQYLQSLDQAYLALMGGEQVRQVTDQNGESVAYTMASATGLLNLIRVLALQPGMNLLYRPISLGQHVTRRPLQFWF